MTRRTLALVALTASLGVCAPALAQEPETEPGLVFTFKRASIHSFLGYLSREAGFTFVEEASVSGDISATAEKPISRDEALEVLRAWLLPKDRTLLRAGNVVRIVTMEEAKRRGLPVRVGSDPEAIHDSEELVTQVMPLQYVQASDVKRELEGLISDEGTVMIEATSNSLVVRDTSASIRRFAEVLRALDTAVTSELHVRVFRLQNARSDEVAKVITDLFGEGQALGGGGGGGNNARGGRGGGRGGRGGGGMREMARMFFQGGGGGGSRGGGAAGGGAQIAPVNVSEDPRTNSVVVTASTDQLRLVEKLVTELDQEPDPVVTQIRTFTLENADAAEMAQTLTSLFEDPEVQQQSGGGGGNQQAPRWVRRMMGRNQGNQESESDSRYSTQAKFTTDARTNSLIVSATAEDMAMVEDLVEQLDADPTGW
jgi:general secretion pathway protein D